MPFHISHKLTSQSIRVLLDIYPELLFFLEFYSLAYSATVMLGLILCFGLYPRALIHA